MSEKSKMMQQANFKRLAQFKKWQRAWDKLTKEQSATNPDLATLRQCIAELVGWHDSFPQFDADWKDLEFQITERYKEAMRGFETTLRQACKQAGHSVDGESPNLMVDGLIRVTLDKEKNSASINGKKINSLSLSVIMQQINTEDERIWKRKFDPLQFLQELRSAYETVCRDRVIGKSEYVSLQTIHQKLKERDKKYTTELFSADLSRLLAVSISQTELRGLEFAPVRDARKATYIYDHKSQSGRYIGLIRFTQES